MTVLGDHVRTKLGLAPVAPVRSDTTPKERRVLGVLPLLRDLAPKAFCDPPRPLKIGVHRDLVALLAGEAPPWLIGRALRLWCRRPEYRRVLIPGATRVDLDAQPAGVVEAAQSLASERNGEPRQSSAIIPANRTRSPLAAIGNGGGLAA